MDDATKRVTRARDIARVDSARGTGRVARARMMMWIGIWLTMMKEEGMKDG